MGRHLLGPHVVGHRIVVRRVLDGERGPSGGPALTDVLGVCLAWGDGVCTVRREDGTEVSIPVAAIVSGKPVPPRASVRHRITPRDAQLAALAMWPHLVTRELGAWTLRWSDTSTARRANSVLAMGPAGVADPVARVIEHYAGLDRRPIAAVLPDSAEDELFRSRGWVPESHESDSLFQIAGVASARRTLGDRPSYAVHVEVSGDLATARVGDEARGIATYARDWLGLRGIEVSPERRRRGLGLAVVGALLDWGAERGATTAYLQVLADNEPALSLYERLGFTTHHAYRYLAEPHRPAGGALS